MSTVLVNLLSKQTVQNYIAIRETKPERVVALATKNFEDQVNRFQDLTGVSHSAIQVEPYAMQEIMSLLEQYIKDLPSDSEIILNFTGGTKIMAFASVFAPINTDKISVKLLYVNTHRECCEHYLKNASGLEPVTPVPFSTEIHFSDFVKLSGEQIKSVEPDVDIIKRRNMTELLFANRKGLSDCYGDCFSGSGKQRKLRSKHSFVMKGRGGDATIEWESDNLSVKPSDRRAFAIKIKKPAKYMTGGWLEEFCFLKLLNANTFDKVLSGVVIDLSVATQKRRTLSGKQLGDKNEIDIVVTNGVRATLIECKSGRELTQDHLYKLHALTDHLCGAFGSAILVTTISSQRLRRERPELFEKADDMEIRIVAGDEITEIAEIITKYTRK